jgi:hypothetical protein
MTNDRPKLLVDGDTLAYRAAFSCQDYPVDDAVEKVDDLIYEVIQEVFWDANLDDLKDDMKIFLTRRETPTPKRSKKPHGQTLVSNCVSR